jgi:hypothetical protein
MEVSKEAFFLSLVARPQPLSLVDILMLGIEVRD